MKLFLFACFLVTVNCLARTKFVDKGLYKIHLQHDGRYLSVKPDGSISRGEWYARPDQKFTFASTKTASAETWKLSTTEGALGPQWKISPVSHGKSLFKDVATGMCLRGAGTGGVKVDGDCGKDDPTQRWYIEETTVEEKQ